MFHARLTRPFSPDVFHADDCGRAGLRRAARHHAPRLLPHRQRQQRDVQPRSRSDRAAALAGTSRRPSTTPISATTSSKSATADEPLLYSRGFGSIFGEWVDTDEAKQLNRTFSESLRFPAPDAPVQIVLKKRDANKDAPSAKSGPPPSIPKTCSSTAPPPSPGPLIAIQKIGDPETKFDLLILGDGYAAAERDQIRERRRRADGNPLLATSPFNEHRKDFNVWGSVRAAARVAASRARPPASIATRRRRHLRRLRLRALHLDLRQSRVARRRPVRALRVRRDPGQRQDLRRRRHLQPLRHRCRRQRFGRLTFSCTNSATTSPDSPTSTTPRTVATSRNPALEPWEPNVTALLDPAT